MRSAYIFIGNGDGSHTKDDKVSNEKVHAEEEEEEEINGKCNLYGRKHQSFDASK